jgi:membrane protein DedA with SNARE-associated domain
MSFSSVAMALIDHLGLAGIALGVFLNGLSVPGLSEVLLPLAGVAVRQGRLNLGLLLVVVLVAQLAGLSLAYVIGRRGGLPILERYGKYVLISHHDLVSTQRAFEKYGGRLVVVGSFIPGIQGLVGYVAGLAEMRYQRFVVAVLVGKTVWIGGLLYLGSVLGGHLALIDRSIKQIGVIVLAGLVVGGIWYVQRHRRRSMT